MLAALSGAVTPLMAPAQADSLTRNDETIGAADAAAPQLFGVAARRRRERV